MKVAIVGAGMMGMMLAFRLAREGYAISIFEKRDLSKNTADLKSSPSSGFAASAAAGMLAPYSEMDSAEQGIFELGMQSLPLWQQLAKDLQAEAELDIDYRGGGTLVVAHPQDAADYQHFFQHLKRKLPDSALGGIVEIDRQQLSNFGSSLAERFPSALHFKEEASVSPTACLHAIEQAFKNYNVKVYDQFELDSVDTTSLAAVGRFEHIIDCRGLGAKNNLRGLRGVRGETILVHSPEVELHAIVRLMHPRYKLYIAPRSNHHFIIGASQIESSSDAPMSVLSALELLSAAYSIDPKFGEASIVNLQTGIRPAMADNFPCVKIDDGVIRVNGLFRHGVMVSPAIAERIVLLLRHGIDHIHNEENLLLQTAPLLSVPSNHATAIDAKLAI